MKKTVDRFLRGIGVLGLSVVGMMLVAALVALRHIMETPQPLESYLPGEAHIYRWKRSHIFYKEAPGPDEAPPLVLLHAPDIGASSYEMRHLMEPLAQRFRVYAPDLPGFGLSDRPQMDYSAETYIALLQDFLRDVVGRPAVLVASGLSNNYAVAVAQRSPEQCKRLVLISPSTLFHHESGQAFLPALMQAPFLGTLLYPVVSTHLALRYRAASQHAPAAGTSPRQISITCMPPATSLARNMHPWR
jgi:pimeloyl-ACP methyl ester carboxylesterase